MQPTNPQLVQCAANFSEGRRPEVVEAIAEAMSGVPGATVIDFSHDADHNRAVVTVLGSPDRVAEAAFLGVAEAVKRIDLREHDGCHPRIGAADVVPFTPLRGTPMAACVEASIVLAKRVADELAVPVYLYEETAEHVHSQRVSDLRRSQKGRDALGLLINGPRKALPDLRSGGFERLRELGLTGERAPDYGPDHVHPTAGVCVIGARSPLIAFNVNLRTKDLGIARDIASKIRERGGGLPGVRALGIALESRGIVQVSMNITRTDRTPLHEVFEFVRREAEARGVEVAESELIGALPLDAVIDAARNSLQLPGLNESRILDLWYSRLSES